MSINKIEVNKIIADTILCPIEQVLPEKHLIHELFADSITFVDLIVNISNVFSVNISDEELSDINTVQDIYNLLENKTN